MRKTLTILLLLFWTMAVRGQENKATIKDTTGIRFEQALSWSQVLARANTEHKYIFVDCYATWCGPCKIMDQVIYVRTDVGNTYNNQFISVKLQMDQTPADDSRVKGWYETARMMQSAYAVNAYPTFLFFDPSGKPVHKSVGSMGAAAFIQLAADAQNPDKQYYAILYNFKPGKMDTAEEKSLAWSLVTTDRELGGKLAGDYLSRMPESKLGSHDKLDLMAKYYNNAQVATIAISFIRKLLNKEIDYAVNVDFIENFAVNQDVQKKAEKYLDQAPETSLYRQPDLLLIETFTKNQHQRGYRFLMDNATRIDTIMKDPDWAQSRVADIITRTELKPLLDSAKKTNISPDFDAVEEEMTGLHGKYYANRVILDAKVSWFNYLVKDQKNVEYWPQLIREEIAQLRSAYDDQSRRMSTIGSINDMCYDLFLHINDTTLLNLGVKWMAEVVNFDPKNSDNLDTYACLLYKAGKNDEALANEFRVLQLNMTYRKYGTYTAMMHTTLAIQRMWKGDKIWEEKEFQ